MTIIESIFVYAFLIILMATVSGFAILSLVTFIDWFAKEKSRTDRLRKIFNLKPIKKQLLRLRTYAGFIKLRKGEVENK